MSNQKREIVEPRHNVPDQQDEEDILEEVGGERDEETGELVVDEETVQELGAVDAETVRLNRRLKNIANKQKTGKKGVSFGIDDPLIKYDGLLKTWGPNSIYIRVKRLTGAQVTHIIKSCPRSGVELYDALLAIHGQHPEAEYETKFQSTDGHQYRGTGRITLPDTRPQGQQGQSAYLSPPQPPTPGTPQAFDPNSMMSMFQGMFDVFQRMQSSAQPRTPVMPQMPPMPPPNDPAAQLSWMQQMFDMFQRMQGMNNAPVQPPPPQPQSQASSIAETMTLMQQMFDLFQRMQPPRESVNPMLRPRMNAQTNGQTNGQRPPYMAQQQPQKSAAEQFRDQLRELRAFVSVRDEIDSLIGGGRRVSEFDDAPDVENDGPVRVEDISGIKAIRNNDEEGSLRFWETIGANVPSAIKWIGERVKEAQTEEQRRRRPRQQQLPPGYVEVGPNYRPPPGYIAVPEEPPEEEPEQDLPPPPANMPPPIQSTPWDTPEE